MPLAPSRTQPYPPAEQGARFGRPMAHWAEHGLSQGLPRERGGTRVYEAAGWLSAITNSYSNRAINSRY